MVDEPESTNKLFSYLLCVFLFLLNIVIIRWTVCELRNSLGKFGVAYCCLASCSLITRSYPSLILAAALFHLRPVTSSKPLRAKSSPKAG